MKKFLKLSFVLMLLNMSLVISFKTSLKENKFLSSIKEKSKIQINSMVITSRESATWGFNLAIDTTSCRSDPGDTYCTRINMNTVYAATTNFNILDGGCIVLNINGAGIAPNSYYMVAVNTVDNSLNINPNTDFKNIKFSFAKLPNIPYPSCSDITTPYMKWSIRAKGAKIVYVNPAAPTAAFEAKIDKFCVSLEAPGSGTWFHKDPFKVSTATATPIVFKKQKASEILAGYDGTAGGAKTIAFKLEDQMFYLKIADTELTLDNSTNTIVKADHGLAVKFTAPVAGDLGPEVAFTVATDINKEATNCSCTTPKWIVVDCGQNDEFRIVRQCNNGSEVNYDVLFYGEYKLLSTKLVDRMEKAPPSISSCFSIYKEE